MTFGTFFAGIAGFANLTTGARATAVTGTAPGICSATEDCGFIPVTFPTSLTQLRRHQPADSGVRGRRTRSSTDPIAATTSDHPAVRDRERQRRLAGHPAEPEPVPGNGAAVPGLLHREPEQSGLDLPVWIDAQTGNINSVRCRMP